MCFLAPTRMLTQPIEKLMQMGDKRVQKHTGKAGDDKIGAVVMQLLPLNCVLETQRRSFSARIMQKK